MSQIEKYCKNYTNFERIGTSKYAKVYKAENKQTKNIVAIKEIDKSKYESLTNEKFNEKKIIYIINSENSIQFKSKIDSKDYFFMVMDLCINNLEDYIKSKTNDISINEIREILNQLNNAFKIMNNKKIIHGDLQPKNILISIDRLDKCKIKLSDFGSIKPNNCSISINEVSLTTPPEILNGENYNLKSNIWSLGIIIYFMLHKKYPYNGKNEYLLLQDINLSKKLKISNDDKLNNLIYKMLKININERISWEDYFNHPFFNQNSDLFKFNCEKHSQIINNYCKECKKNICDNCLDEHSTHTIIPFFQIGLNDNEIKRIENIFKDIDNKLYKLNKMKKEIEKLFIKMKSIKENKLIYKNDIENNYKEYYIKYLENINKILDNNEIKVIDLTIPKNEIICIYDIKKGKDDKDDYLNNPIRILNSYEEAKKDYSYLEGIDNEKEIKENCEFYLNENKIDFCYKYKFTKEGKYSIKIIFKKPLKNINYMFYKCNKLFSIDLSNFNTKNLTNMNNVFSDCFFINSLNLSNFNSINVINMNNIFYNCSSLISLNLSNFNTNNVTNMKMMFSECSSLTSLNLSSFNTTNVTNMEGMFQLCTSLNSLNLSNFNTNKVTNMKYMFQLCSSLTSLNLSNFNTTNVIDMEGMFQLCNSLNSLDLSNFNNSNATNMKMMFSECSSLISLNLSNFNTNKVNDMESMFQLCSSLTSLNLSSFNTNNVTNMKMMFSECSKLISLNLSNFNTNKVTNMYSMFSNCSSLTSLNLSNCNTNNVTNMGYMFYYCSSLTSLNLSNFHINNVTNLSWMFYNCSSLTSLNLSNFHITNVIDMGFMFSGINKKNCKLICKEQKILKEFS